MPPKRPHNDVDDEYRDGGQPARKKKDIKEIQQRPLQPTSGKKLHSTSNAGNVIDLRLDESEDDFSFKNTPQTNQESDRKPIAKTAPQPKTRRNQKAANPIAKKATPPKTSAKASAGKVIVKELPEPTSDSEFPRYADGRVYIIIHQSDQSYQYILHEDVLSRASPEFKTRLLDRVVEFDQKGKGKATKKCAKGPATFGATGKARFDLEYSPEHQRWVLNRTPFTAQLPPPKDEVEPSFVNQKSSGGRENLTTDDPSCPAIQPNPSSMAQNLGRDYRLNREVNHCPLNAAVDHKEVDLESSVLKRFKNDSTTISPETSESTVATDKESKLNQGMKAHSFSGQPGYVESSLAQMPVTKNETENSPKGKNATLAVQSICEFITENRIGAKDKVDEVQRSSVIDLQRPSTDSWDGVEFEIPGVSQGVEEISSEETRLDRPKPSPDSCDLVHIAIPGVSQNMDEEIAIEKELTNELIAETSIAAANLVDKGQQASVFDPPKTSPDSSDEANVCMPDFGHAMDEEFVAEQNISKDALETEVERLEKSNLTDSTNLSSGADEAVLDSSYVKQETRSKSEGAARFSNTHPEHSPSASSLQTDGPGYFPPRRFNDTAIQPNSSCSIEAATLQTVIGGSRSLKVDPRQSIDKLRNDDDVSSLPHGKSLKTHIPLDTSRIKLNTSVTDAYPNYPSKCLCTSYDNLLKIIYNRPPTFNPKSIATALRQYETLTALAAEFECVPLVQPHIAASSLNYGSMLGKAIKEEPTRWLKLSISLKNPLIFREAVVHIVGMQPEWPWAEHSLEEFSVKVQNLIHSKAEKLSTMKLVLHELLLSTSISLKDVRVSIYSVNRENSATWVVTQIWRDWFSSHTILFSNDAKHYTPFIGQVYRTLAVGGDAYLRLEEVAHILTTTIGKDFKDWAAVSEDLTILKEFARGKVQEICENYSMLDVDKEKIKYLTCTEISDYDLPWTGRNS